MSGFFFRFTAEEFHMSLSTFIFYKIYSKRKTDLQFFADQLQKQVPFQLVKFNDGEWHWICFSPKKFKAALPEMYPLANELKVVVFNKHDLTWAEEHAAKLPPECLLYLQPEWDKRETMMPPIVEHVQQDPRWRISLQTHKYLDIP